MTRDPAPSEDPGASRAINPRRALPNGRALIGALLVTTAAVVAFAASRPATETAGTPYVVLRHDVDAGERLTLDDVALEPMVLSPATTPNALTSLDGLDDVVAMTSLRAGGLLDPRDVVRLPDVDGEAVPGLHELTIPVPRERTPPSLRRGDRVTLLAVSSHDRLLRTAVEDALVLDYEPTAAGVASAGQTRLTLALSDAGDVATVALLSHESLTVVRTTTALEAEYPAQTAVPQPAPPPAAAAADTAPPEIRISAP